MRDVRCITLTSTLVLRPRYLPRQHGTIPKPVSHSRRRRSTVTPHSLHTFTTPNSTQHLPHRLPHPVLIKDRFGCRTLLLLCTAGLCLCFVMVTILPSLNTTSRGYGATAFIFLFQLIYGVDWLPVPWFYPSEISTTRTKTSMQAIASG